MKKLIAFTLLLNSTQLFSQLFGPEQVIFNSPSLETPRVVIARDLNKDGFADPITQGINHGITWFANYGDGNFSFPKIIENNWVIAIHSDDIDNDGDFDIISDPGNNLVLYANNGDGTFNSIILKEGDADIRSIFTYDLDKDSDKDIIVTFNDHIAWFQNKGGLFFSSAILVSPIPLNEPTGLAFGDINGDEKVDIAFASDGLLGWYPGLGNNNFDSLQIIEQADSLDFEFIYMLDLNGDETLDILTSAFSGGIYLYANNGNGKFSLEQEVLSLYGTDNLSISDLNNDGDVDVIYSTLDGNNILAWLINQNNGKFGSQEIISDHLSPRGNFPVDLDNDGDIDILMTSWINGNTTSNKIVWFENQLITTPSFEPYVTDEHFNLYPNPFTNFTTVSYSLKNPDKIKCEVYNINGKLEVVLSNQFQEAGDYDIQWDGRNAIGDILPNGTYMCVLKTNTFVKYTKLNIVR